MQPEDLILTDLNGTEIAPVSKSRASTELAMHLMSYKMRTDINAVVHAHPTVTVAFTVANMPLSKCILPEVVCSLGVIPVAPYATPSTPEVTESIKGLLNDHDAIVLDHHGVLTLGHDIWDAFYKLETLEHHAQTMLVAHLLGNVQPLFASQVNKLLNIRSVYGYTKPLSAEALLSPSCSQPDMETSA